MADLEDYFDDNHARASIIEILAKHVRRVQLTHPNCIFFFINYIIYIFTSVMIHCKRFAKEIILIFQVPSTANKILQNIDGVEIQEGWKESDGLFNNQNK